ncbi:hypothetical protein PHMEG_0004819 [Phytophthora megakarya]|uniref:MYND-type domain-containing protein n=1 Tax=Phytophthora megakarya TaxID=4795 RepID=A0A225WT22_9STRA|nr:hypothetical protein PHMEG_0004819 [Phytophthora megakarya]
MRPVTTKEKYLVDIFLSNVVTASSNAAAYMTRVGQSNEATQLIKANKLREAENLLRDVLERKPEDGFDAVSVALTQNELGGLLRQFGELDEALKLLQKALKVRDQADERAEIRIALRVTATSRETRSEIRQERKRICSNAACETLNYKDGGLHACMRCRCVFYCSKTCEKQDWKSRHKLYYQPIKK